MVFLRVRRWLSGEYFVVIPSQKAVTTLFPNPEETTAEVYAIQDNCIKDADISRELFF